jgi:hypothetical protein
MDKIEFIRNVGNALVVSEENYLALWSEFQPAINGIALDDSCMAYEWFRNSKERKHLCQHTS